MSTRREFIGKLIGGAAACAVPVAATPAVQWYGRGFYDLAAGPDVRLCAFALLAISQWHKED